MKRRDLADFIDRIDEHLSGTEPILIERQGEAIGIYRPFAPPVQLPQPDRAAGARAAAALAATLAEFYAQTGMTEDEFVAEFMRDDDDEMAR